MSDPTLEEESLISQEDIDKLLDSSSIEEAEETFLNDEGDTMDDLGELSQSDIDSLMNSNVSGLEIPMDEIDPDDDDMELISQDDIDQLMNSSVSPEEEDKALPVDVDDPEDDDFAEFSQDDITSLMSGRTENSEVENTADEGAEPDSLLVEDEIVDLADEPVALETPEPAVKNKEPEDDYVISESEAVDVQANLVSQETIDDLIRNFDAAAPSDPVILDEETQLEDEPLAELLPSQETEPDAFLKPDADVTVLDFDEEDGDVSQDDIDALLLESDDDEEGEEDDILISQDDIDTLLMAADQEDEDVLGDLMNTDFDGELDDETEEEDILDTGGFDEGDEADDEDQVVLQDEDELEEQPVKPMKKKRAAGVGSPWYKSKLVIACASGLIAMGIAVPLAYFLFFSGGKESPVPQLAVEAQREVTIESVDITIKTQPDIKKSGNMILKDFVILASDVSKDMAYITADISIDYSDQRAYLEIQDNLSFYRDIIYESINKSLVFEKRDQLTEADILSIVETTLKKVFPEQYIDRVSFKSFKAS